MPKRVADVGEGNKDSSGVYGIIRDLIVEGKDARFVNKKGRYVLNWPRALDCFTDYKAKKNPQFKSKKICRRNVSNGLRSALLNYYKKEGAKEFKESKKVNEKDEVVERQFQMPPRLFESMFGDVKLTDDSEEDEQDTSSIASEASEGDHKAEVIPSSGASDTGFDEVMDISFNDLPLTVEPSDFTVPCELPTSPCLDDIKTEEDNILSDLVIPQVSQNSLQMFDTSMLDSALEEICSDGISDEISDEGMDLFGVVQDICPTSGSVKGGFQFYISLTEELPDDVTSGLAQFEGVANVVVQKLNPFTLSGIVPASQEPGDVPVSVVTETGQRLGMTCFTYVDEMREMIRQMVKDPTLQSMWFAIWSQEHGFFGNDSDVTQMLGPLNMQDPDSSVQTKQQQSLKVLQLLVYTAAQTDARQFIKMIFSTSAGEIVFNSYKDRMPLPEDIARANGHEELAQYLQEINTRLSKEHSCNAQSNTIDWLELAKAAQKQALVAQDESSKQSEHPCENDDNSSDYFADAETSSSGSFDLDTGWSDSEDKEPCTKVPKVQVPTERPATSEQGPSCEIPVKVSDSKINKESTWGYTYSLSEWLSKWRKRGDTSMEQNASLKNKDDTESSTFQRLPGVTYFSGLFGKCDDTSKANVRGSNKTDTAKPKECGQHNHVKSSRRTGAALKYKGIMLTLALLTVLAGFKLREGPILHWAVGNGYTRISTILLQCGLFVDAPGFLHETPLHLAAKNGFKDLVDVLIQSGGIVNARNFPRQETPLHLAAQNGHQYIAEFLIQHGAQVNARTYPYQETPLHLAAKNGRLHVTDVLIQHGSDVNARNIMKQVPLHLAAQSGHQHVAKVLIQHGSDVNARSVPLQDTPLHLAAENGHKHVAEVLQNVNARNSGHSIQIIPVHSLAKKVTWSEVESERENGRDDNATNAPWRKTLLHLAVKNGHKHTEEVSIQHNSDISAVNNLKMTPIHVAARNGHNHIVDVFMQHRSDAHRVAVEYGQNQSSEVAIRYGNDAKALGGMKQNGFHLAAEDKQCLSEVLLHCGDNTTAGNKLFRVLIKNRQARQKPFKVALKQLQTRTQHVKFSDPVNWSHLFDGRPQRCSKKRSRSNEEPVHFNCAGKRCHYSLSNDKTKDTSDLRRHMCVPCADRTDKFMCCTSVVDPPTSYSSRLDRNTGEVLSWYGLISGYTGKYPKNSTNEVLMDSEVYSSMHSYDQQQHFIIIRLVGIIVGLCLQFIVLNIFTRVHGQRMRLQKPVKTFFPQDKAITTTEATTNRKSNELNQCKEETTDERSLHGIYAHHRSTNRGSEPGNVTEKYFSGREMRSMEFLNLYRDACRIKDTFIEDASTDVLRVERLKSWLACDCGQEDLSSVDCGGPELKMLRDVPCTLINELSSFLNPGGRWKDLGERLNFNRTQINNFAMVKKNATQAMLEEWGQRDYATVAALQEVFHSMKWSKEERICAEYV